MFIEELFFKKGKKMYYSSIINKILKKLKSILGLQARLFLLILLFFVGLLNASAQCGIAAALQPKASSGSACSGSVIGVSLLHSSVVRWIYRDNSGSWNTFSSSSQSNYSHKVTFTQAGIREYRAIVNHSSCSADTSGAVFVNLIMPGYGNNNNIAPFATKDTACSGTTLTFFAPQAFVVSSWIYRDNYSGNWQVYATGNLRSVNFSASTSTTLIRSVRMLMVRTGACMFDTSAAKDIVFTPHARGTRADLVPETSASEVCEGTTINLSLSTSFKVNLWQFRDGSGAWQNGTSTTNTYNNFSGTTASTFSRQFRVVVSDTGTCQSDTSAIVSVQIKARENRTDTLLRPLTAQTNYCSGSTIVLNSGLNNTFAWLRGNGPVGPWVNLNKSASVITDTNTTVTTAVTRYYRYLVFTGTCQSDTSAATVVYIKPYTHGNSVSKTIGGPDADHVCSGIPVYIQSFSTGDKCLYRNNNIGPWLLMPTLTDGNTTVTVPTERSYRLLHSDAQNCRIDTNEATKITIYPKQFNGITVKLLPLFADSTVNCSGKQIQVAINNTSTTYSVEKWIYNENNGPFMDIPFSAGNTSFTQNTNTVFTPTQRSYKALLYDNQTCRVDSSLPCVVMIEPQSYGNINSVAPASTELQHCSGTGSIIVDVNVPPGYIIKGWLRRDNTSSTWLPINALTTTLYDNNTTVNVHTVRSYRTLLYNSSLCRTDTTAEVNVTIRTRVSGSNFEIPATSALTCSDKSFTSTLTVPTGFSINRWIWRDNSGAWGIDSSGLSSLTSRVNVLYPVQREIRAVLYSQSALTCTADTTLPITVTILPYRGGSVTNEAPTVAAKVCAGNRISLNAGSVSNFVAWMAKDTGSWYLPSYSELSTFMDSNTYSTTAFTREYRYIYLRSGNTCIVDTSQSVFTTITPVTALASRSKTIETPASVCSGSPVSISTTLNSWENALMWQYHNGNGVWKQLSSSTDVNSQVNTPVLRHYRLISLNTEFCSYDTSNTTTTIIKPYVFSVNASLAPYTVTSACKWSTNLINIIPPSGNTVMYWLNRKNTENWQVLNTGSLSVYNIDYNKLPENVSSVSYRVMLKNTAGCSIDTSAMATIRLHSAVAGNVSITPMGKSIACAQSTDNNISISLPAGYQVNKWIYQNNNEPGWHEVLFGSSFKDMRMNVPHESTRTYRAILSSIAQCRIDTTASLKTVILQQSGRTVDAWVPVAEKAEVCSKQTIRIFSPNNAKVTSWIYSENGGPVKNHSLAGSGSTYEVFTDVTATQLRTYYALQTSNTYCRVDTSMGVSVVIHPSSGYGNSSVATITDPQGSACEKSQISLHISNPLLTANVQKWIYRDNNGPWMRIHNFHYAPLTNAVITRDYRALLLDPTNNQCRIDTTEKTTISIRPLVFGKDTSLKLSATDTSCNGVGVSINLTPTNLQARWLYRDNNGPWRSIPYVSGNGIFDNNTNVSQPMRRTYAAIVEKASGCSVDTSVTASSLLLPIGGGNANNVKVSIADTVCAFSKYVYASVNTSNIKCWIYRNNFTGPWVRISNYTGNTILHSINTNTTLYREYRVILVKGTTCTEDTSLSDTVFIRAGTYRSINTVTPSGNASSVCNGSPIQVWLPALASISSDLSFSRWIYKTNNGPWTVWAGTGTSVNDRNTLVNTVETRSYRAILLNTATCSEDTTLGVTITINPFSYASVTTTVLSGSPSICSGSGITLNTNPGSGKTIHSWIFRDGATQAWQTIYNTSTNISDVNTFTSANLVRTYRALIFTASTCRVDTSATANVTINAPAIGVNNSIAPVVPSSACLPATTTISLSPGSNTIKSWIYKVNTGPWGVLSNSTSTSINDKHYDLTPPATKSYAVIIHSSSTCRTDTTATRTMSIVASGVGNMTGIVFSAPSTVCAGVSFSVSVTSGLPANSSNLQWIFRDNSGDWQRVSSSGLFHSETKTNVLVNTTRQYRLLALNNTLCRMDTSNAVSVNIVLPVPGNDNTVTPSGPGSVCLGSSASITFGSTIDSWLYRFNNSQVWLPVTSLKSSPLIHNNTYDTSISSVHYRVIMRKGSCALDTSGISTLNIFPLSAGSNTSVSPVAVNSSVCLNGTVNLYLNNSGRKILRWIYRDNNTGPWNTLFVGDLVSVSDVAQINSSLIRSYRVLFQSTGSCSVDTSAATNVTMNYPASYVNSLTAPTSSRSDICSGDSVILIAPSSGGTTLLWQYRNNTIWLPLKEVANSFTEYNTISDTLLTRNYRVVAFNSSNCRIDTSNIRAISIQPAGKGNLSIVPACSDTDICSGAAVSVSVPANNILLGWIYRDNNTGPWLSTTIKVNTYIDLNTTVASNTVRSYRAIVGRSSGCGWDTTASRNVVINSITAGNVAHYPIAASDVVCSGAPALISLIQSPGTVNSWLYRDNQTGPWLKVPIGFYMFNDTNTQVSTGKVRSYRALVLFNSTCTIDTSAPKTIDILPFTRGNIAQQPQAQANTVCSGDTVKLNYSSSSSTIINRWIFKNGVNGSWNILSPFPIDSVSDKNTTVASPGIRYYRTIVYTPLQCRYDSSAERAVSINPFTYGNNNTQSPSAPNDTICKGAPVTLLNNTTRPLLGWLYNDLPSGNWTLVSPTTNSYTDLSTATNTSGFRRYRMLVRRASSGCFIDSTSAALVHIQLPASGRNNQIVPVLSQNTICSGGTISATVFGTVSHWLYKDNNGAWIATEFGKKYLNLTNTTVGQKTIRSICALIENNQCAFDTTAVTTVVINTLGSMNNTIRPTAQPSTVCAGNTVQLKISGYSGNIVNWLYRDNAGTWFILPGGSDSLSQTLTTTGTREYKLWIFTGCFTDSTLSTSVTVIPSPAIPVITKVGDSLVCSVSTGVTYEWFKNGIALSQSNQQKIKPIQSGSYTVKVTNASGCHFTSSAFIYIITHTQTEESDALSIFPNPTREGINIVLPAKAERIAVSIISALGEVVMVKEEYNKTNVAIQLAPLSKGVYFVQVIADGKRTVQRILYQ